ncbi:MAG: response regulator receiver sensor signal transduction histidine kinase [uncultured bacterium]|nr:MAG: response regulator receiver sensor signal transduction histidine kinase [uncultured bacterium]
MNKKLIHIVEDEEKTRKTLSLIMEMEGHEVLAFENGEIALHKIVELKTNGKLPDLLICDIQMPKMNGEEFIQKLKELNIFIPILVITGYGDKQNVIRLMRLGCMDFLDKPFESTEIQERVRMLLDETMQEEREVKRKERLAMVGDNVLALVHDLCNILCGTQGYAYLMSLEKNGDISAFRRNMDNLMRSTELAKNLCQQMLRVKNGESCSVKLTTDIKSLINGVSDLLRVLAPENILIKTVFLSDVITFKINAERIKQVLINLGINSVQAMPKGGELILSAGFRDKGNEKKGAVEQELVIEVKDTGTGISPENISKILTGKFTTKAEGYGIGLQSAQAIMKEHEGSLDIKSEVNKWTEIKLIFPERK